MLHYRSYLLFLLVLLGLNLQWANAQVTGSTFNGVELLSVTYNGMPGNPAILTQQSNPTNPAYVNDASFTLKNTTSAPVYHNVYLFYDNNGDGVFDTTDPIVGGIGFSVAAGATGTGTFTFDILSTYNIDEDLYMGFDLLGTLNPSQMDGGAVTTSLIYNPPSNLQQALTITTSLSNKTDPVFECQPLEVHNIAGYNYLSQNLDYETSDYQGSYILMLKIWAVDDQTGVLELIEPDKYFYEYHPMYNQTGAATLVTRNVSLEVDDPDIETYYVSHYAVTLTGQNGIWIEDGDDPNAPLTPLFFFGEINRCELGEGYARGSRGSGRGSTGGNRLSMETPSSGLSAFPNPTSGTVSLQFDLAEAGEIHYTLMNLSGQTVLPRQTLLAKSGAQEVAVDLGSLSPSVYICRLETAQGIEHVQIVKSLY